MRLVFPGGSRLPLFLNVQRVLFILALVLLSTTDFFIQLYSSSIPLRNRPEEPPTVHSFDRSCSRTPNPWQSRRWSCPAHSHQDDAHYSLAGCTPCLCGPGNSGYSIYKSSCTSFFITRSSAPPAIRCFSRKLVPHCAEPSWDPWHLRSRRHLRPPSTLHAATRA